MLKLTNGSGKAIKIILEPWAEEYNVPPNEVIEIVASEPKGNLIDIEYHGDEMVIHGWSDDMRIQTNGEKLEPEFTS